MTDRRQDPIVLKLSPDVGPRKIMLEFSSTNYVQVSRVTRHTLRRKFFIVSMYRAELTVFPASKNSVM